MDENELESSTLGASEVNTLIKAAELKIDNTDFAGKKKKKQSDTTSFSKILFTFADGKDKMHITLAFIAALVSGAGMPSASFLFGNIINGFGGKPNEDVII